MTPTADAGESPGSGTHAHEKQGDKQGLHGCPDDDHNSVPRPQPSEALRRLRSRLPLLPLARRSPQEPAGRAGVGRGCDARSMLPVMRKQVCAAEVVDGTIGTHRTLQPGVSGGHGLQAACNAPDAVPSWNPPPPEALAVSRAAADARAAAEVDSRATHGACICSMTLAREQRCTAQGSCRCRRRHSRGLQCERGVRRRRRKGR